MAFTPVARQPHSSVMTMQGPEQCRSKNFGILFMAKKVALLVVAIFAAYLLTFVLKAEIVVGSFIWAIACLGAANCTGVRKYVSRWFEFSDEDIPKRGE